MIAQIVAIDTSRNDGKEGSFAVVVEVDGELHTAAVTYRLADDTLCIVDAPAPAREALSQEALWDEMYRDVREELLEQRENLRAKDVLSPRFSLWASRSLHTRVLS